MRPNNAFHGADRPKGFKRRRRAHFLILSQVCALAAILGLLTPSPALAVSDVANPAQQALAKQYRTIADHLIEQGRYTEAIAKLDLALREDPSNRAAQASRQTAVQAIERQKVAAQVSQELHVSKRVEQSEIEQRSIDLGFKTAAEATAFLSPTAQEEAPAAAAEDGGSVASATYTAKEAKAQQKRIEKKLKSAQGYLAKEEYNKALELYEQILTEEPANDAVRELVAEARAARIQAEAGRTFQQALAAYGAGDILGAEDLWLKTLEINPDHELAATYLGETRDEVAGRRAELLADDRQARIDREMEAKLNTKVESLLFDQPTALYDFLTDLKIFADLNFNIVAGEKTTITGAFSDMTIREILDSALHYRGLKWEVTGAVITIDNNLRIRYFTLDNDKFQKVRNLIADDSLESALWKDGPPVAGAKIELDERNSQLIVTAPERDLDRFADLLKGLASTASLQYVMERFKIQPEKAIKIEALLRQQLNYGRDIGMVESERLLSIDGEDLIIVDTIENIRKAQEILADEKLLQVISSGEIEIGRWNLTPIDALEKSGDTLREYFLNHVDVIETMLYSANSKSEAMKEGRRIWVDEILLTITITDTAERIEAISNYIAGLELIEVPRKSEIVFLKHADVDQLASDLREVLGIESSTGRSGETWNTTVRVGRDEKEWSGHDFRIRLLSVEPNDEWDDNDDSAEFLIVTDASSDELQMDEFVTDFVLGGTGEYEVTPTEIDWRGGSEGSARIEVRFQPDPALAPALPMPTTPSEEEFDLELQSFGDRNAMLIRYQDPKDFQEVMNWIKELDIPVAQVSIETRFVTIYEKRFKEFGSDMSISNLGKKTLDFSEMNMDLVFGRDETLKSIWGSEALAGESLMTGLFPKTNQLLDEAALAGFPYYNIASEVAAGADGTQVSPFVPITSAAFPPGTHPTFNGSPVTWQLRMLEAEGVISSTAGPTVTVMNGEEANFTVGLSQMNPVTPNTNLIGNILSGNLPPGLASQGTTGGGGALGGLGGGSLGGLGSLGGGGGSLGGLGGGGGGTTGSFGGGGTTGGGSGVSMGQPLVEFDVSPLKISATGSIKLDIDIEMSDPPPFGDEDLGQMAYFTSELQTIAELQDGETLILGGWTKKYEKELTSGVPILRDLPYVGKLFFGKNESLLDDVTMVIFLTANISG